MTLVVSFTDYLPAARFDGVPWTEARIEEATTIGGPWTVIDTVPLNIIDADPSQPSLQSFTTTLGTAADLWYRVTFLDNQSGVSEPTIPIQNTEGSQQPATLGPCTSWVTADEVAACRSGSTSSDVSIYDDVAVMASQILFEASGRQFTGVCQRTVRPCGDGCMHWLAAYPGPPYPVWDGRAWAGFGGCPPLSKVKLPGYPVRQIAQVKIDGAVLDPASYRLDGHRWLIRKADIVDGRAVARWWPGCSRLDVDDDQPGTFSVTYLHGVDPPPLGVRAAARLASELYDACGGSSDCSLPDDVVEVVRQGVTVRRLVAAGQALREGSTGIKPLDEFLGGYNPAQLTRRPAVWTPDGHQYARTVGT